MSVNLWRFWSGCYDVSRFVTYLDWQVAGSWIKQNKNKTQIIKLILMLFYVPCKNKYLQWLKKYQELMKHKYSVKVIPKNKGMWTLILSRKNVTLRFYSEGGPGWHTGKVISSLRSDIRFHSFLYTFINCNTSSHVIKIFIFGFVES